MKKSKDNYQTSWSLKKRGWTDTMIKSILGEPDEYRVNPYHKSAAPMRLWSEDKVRRAERTKAFKTAIAKSAGRKEAALKAAKTKRIKCLNYAKNVVITIPKYDMRQLEFLAIEHYNNYHDTLGKYDFMPVSLCSCSREFLNRITVNYLRHECTDYDYELSEIAGKVGVQDAHDILKERVNEAIYEAYPTLKN